MPATRKETVTVVLVLVTGPTGAGKTTVIHYLANHYSAIILPVLTSRRPRGDTPELTRMFAEREAIQVKAGRGLLVLFEYLGEVYAFDGIEAKMALHSDELVVCDYPGDYEMEWLASSLALLVFLMPPSEAALVQRLRKAGRHLRAQDAIRNYRDILARWQDTRPPAVHHANHILVVNTRVRDTAARIVEVARSWKGGRQG